MPLLDHAEVLTSPLLARLGVPHGFSTRRGGVSRPPFDSLNFGNPGDLPAERKDPRANIAENWGRLLLAMGCVGRRVVEVHQVHGGEVWVAERGRAMERKSERVGEEEVVEESRGGWDTRPTRMGRLKDTPSVTLAEPRVTPPPLGAGEEQEKGELTPQRTPQPLPSGRGSDPKADAIVTDAAGCVAAVRVADCAPVLLADVRGRVVAAVHAGWRGVIAGVAGNAVRAMREMGASEILAAVGPCIGPTCFEVGEEVAAEFGRVFGERAPVRMVGEKGFVDLQSALEIQLRDAGVGEVDVLRRCTVSEPALFFSHRRDRGVTGRMVGVVGVCERAR